MAGGFFTTEPGDPQMKVRAALHLLLFSPEIPVQDLHLGGVPFLIFGPREVWVVVDPPLPGEPKVKFISCPTTAGSFFCFLQRTPALRVNSHFEDITLFSARGRKKETGKRERKR